MSVKINPILSLIGKNVINCIKKYNDAYIRLYERITHDDLIVPMIINDSTASSVIIFNELYITKCY